MVVLRRALTLSEATRALAILAIDWPATVMAAMVGQPSTHNNTQIIIIVTLDVNECAEGRHDCNQRAHTVCSNTIGSYTCDCETGYGLNGRICTGTSNIIMEKA